MERTFKLTRSETSLPELLDAAEAWVLSQSGNDALAGEIRLMAEEILTNVMKYAYRDVPLPENLAELSLSVGGGEVTLEIRDAGAAFDPLQARPPELDTPVEDRPEGGLGIHLVRSFADEVSYRREERENVLLMRKRFE